VAYARSQKSYDVVDYRRRCTRTGSRLLPGQKSWHHHVACWTGAIWAAAIQAATPLLSAPLSNSEGCGSTTLGEAVRGTRLRIEFQCDVLAVGPSTLAHTDSSLRTMRWRAEVNKLEGVRSVSHRSAGNQAIGTALDVSQDVRYPFSERSTTRRADHSSRCSQLGLCARSPTPLASHPSENRSDRDRRRDDRVSQ